MAHYHTEAPLCACGCGLPVKYKHGQHKQWNLFLHNHNPVRNVKDYTGKRFGKLVAVERISKEHETTKYLCECDCGNRIVIQTNTLIRKNKKSPKHCGCLRKRCKVSWVARIFSDYKCGAKRRGEYCRFELSIQEFEKIIFSQCHYCGAEPSNILNTQEMKTGLRYSGIDRVDNSKGYISGNCVPCCKICNGMKSRLGKNEFLNHVSKIFHHNKKDGNDERAALALAITAAETNGCYTLGENKG